MFVVSSLLLLVIWYYCGHFMIGPGRYHGLRTPNEGINQRYLKNWDDVADKICFGRT